MDKIILEYKHVLWFFPPLPCDFFLRNGTSSFLFAPSNVCDIIASNFHDIHINMIFHKYLNYFYTFVKFNPLFLIIKTFTLKTMTGVFAPHYIARTYIFHLLFYSERCSCTNASQLSSLQWGHALKWLSVRRFRYIFDNYIHILLCVLVLNRVGPRQGYL